MIKCIFTHNMYTFTCSVVQYALCMHCTWLLYILNDNNVEIDVRPDSRKTYIIVAVSIFSPGERNGYTQQL